MCVDLACRRPYFSLLRQRKVSKRKASQRPWPLQGCPALLAARGVGRKLATLKQAPALDPRPAALLSTANGLGDSVCSFAALTLHTLHTPRRASRASAGACAWESRPSTVSAPSPNPLTTTASFPNRGQQTRTATSLTNTPIRRKTTKLGIQAPLHPGGGEGAGGQPGGKRGVSW